MRTPLSAVALLLTLTLVSSCAASGGDGAAPPDPAKGAGRAGAGGRGAGGAVVVTTAAAVEKPMAVTIRVVGNVEASSSVDVRSQVTGQVQKIGFAEGDDVTADQVLFELDPTPFQLAVNQAKATLARDTAQAKGAAAQLARSDDLFARGLLAKSEHDATATTSAALQATAEADAAALDSAQLQLKYTKITAPVSGRTGALLVHEGALVRPTDANPLVVLNQVTPVFVSFAVPARLLPQLRDQRSREALVVRATPPGTNEAPTTGTVTFLDNLVDQTTDSVRLKATFPNKDHRLWPGAFVDVTVQLAVQPHAIVVPSAAVQVGQQGQFVFLLKPDQTVQPQAVEVAWTDGDDTVLKSGVRPGDTVVTDGQLRLIPGIRVSVKSGPGRGEATQGDQPAGGRRGSGGASKADDPKERP